MWKKIIVVEGYRRAFSRSWTLTQSWRLDVRQSLKSCGKRPVLMLELVKVVNGLLGRILRTLGNLVLGFEPCASGALLFGVEIENTPFFWKS